MTAERMRAWQGPALLTYGFRPFFLMGALWAALAMALWGLVLAGIIAIPTRLDPVSWHAHALLLGYAGAVIAGFLLPAPPMQRLDTAVLLATLSVLLIWTAAPAAPVTGVALMGLAGLHAVRLVRWTGYRTGAEPLVWVLHVAYALIPLGALCLGIAGPWPGILPSAAAQHVWMAGALGLMTLAVMTRATLGHTRQALTANKATVAIYAALIGSLVVRLVAGWAPGTSAYAISALLWIAAFAGFAVAYGPALCKRKTG